MENYCIREALFARREEEYRRLCCRLTPDIAPDTVLGVRMPAIRALARTLEGTKEAQRFLCELPHRYYEENNLHGALLSLLYKDVESYLIELEKFLPYVDNWATCDMMGPKVFKKNLPLVYEHVKSCIASEETFTVRFGVVTLLAYFLDEAFEPEMLTMAAKIQSEEYYVKMAVAWYFSMALVKQYDATIPYIKDAVLDQWTHNCACIYMTACVNKYTHTTACTGMHLTRKVLAGRPHREQRRDPVKN